MFLCAVPVVDRASCRQSGFCLCAKADRSRAGNHHVRRYLSPRLADAYVGLAHQLECCLAPDPSSASWRPWQRFPRRDARLKRSPLRALCLVSRLTDAGLSAFNAST